MITSSLPPELKVMIASAFLLGGGLLALRYPAEREEEPDAAQPAVIQLSETPSSPTTLLEQTSTAFRRDESTRFAPIEIFVNDDEYRDWSHTSMPVPNPATTSIDRTPDPAETPLPDPVSYAGMSVDRRNADRANWESAAEQETVQRPEYLPFQRTTAVTMPEPNPAFFAAMPSPPNLTGLPPSSGGPESTDVNSRPVIPGALVAPSAVLLSGDNNRAVPIATAVPARTVIARPVTPEPKVAADLRAANHNSSVIPAARESQGNVIVIPARTIILPNL